MKIISVFGTRPQYIKHAVLLPHLQQYFTVISIDTTQHYDDALSNDIINDLHIPQPVKLDIDLSTTDAAKRIDKIRAALVAWFETEKPGAVIVYGDTDSTIAAAKAAKETGAALIHIEAGERSHNLQMPEESNRISTDQLADMLFCVSEISVRNLAAEGFAQNVYLAGDLMKDLLLKTGKDITTSPAAEPYYFATIHRNYTQDDKSKMVEILAALNGLDAKVIFPIHPGTKKKLAEYGLGITSYSNIDFIEPLNYTASIHYQKFSKAIITDSGGIQKEAYWLKKKCITLRKETEWTGTLTGNWNTLLYNNLKEKLQPATAIIPENYNEHLYGDGNAAHLIAENIVLFLKGSAGKNRKDVMPIDPGSPPGQGGFRRHVVVSVISDLATDARVQKVCTYLAGKGNDVLLIGRKFSNSLPFEPQGYRSIRMNTWFTKGVLQYMEFTIRLWFKLFFYKADIFVANDLDTLLPNYLHAFFRRKKLVYDSHEFFTGVPELLHSPFKRKVWTVLERLLLKRVKNAYTVNGSIQKLYFEKYGINMKVVKNMPLYSGMAPACKKERPYILIMQGAGINRDRGYEEAIAAMQLLPGEFLLQIIGDGTILNELKELAETLQLQQRVIFIDKVAPAILKEYTQKASLGLTLDKGTSPNSVYSLPNKLFNYIHAGIPVLASDLPEVKKIVEQYAVGICIKEVNAKAIAEGVLQIFADNKIRSTYIANTTVAAKELCWQHEEKTLDTIYDVLTG